MCVWEVQDVQTCPKKNDKDSVSVMQIHKIIKVVTLEAFLSKSQAQYKQDSRHFRRERVGMCDRHIRCACRYRICVYACMLVGGWLMCDTQINPSTLRLHWVQIWYDISWAPCNGTLILVFELLTTGGLFRSTEHTPSSD